GPIGRVAATGTGIVSFPGVKKGESDLPANAETGGYILEPLKTPNKVIGVIKVGWSGWKNDLPEEDTRLLKTLASTIALVLENATLYKEHLEKEHMEEELKIAWDIQHSCLPSSPPQRLTDNLAATTLPARIVGGDYYDFFDLDGSRTGIAIADVAGKGIPAALLMIMLRTVLRALELKTSEAARVMNSLNVLLTGEMDPYRFITMQYAIIDPEKGTVTLSNAGHEPLLIWRKNRSVFDEIHVIGIPLGIDNEFQFGETEVPVESGDLLVFYTDGVVETQNLQKEFWGHENFRKLISECADLPVKDILDRIVDELKRFCGDEPQYDDISLLIFKV
ncbi:MAG: SpoIIE family protein phosphatase, partial [Candidatus Wallbacteria bacterium]|nr:SpoIIE family protein phosphatase [Candidatus Wallbacteria bacterium]